MHARAGGVEDGLGVGGLDGGGDVGNVVREDAAGGCAALYSACCMCERSRVCCENRGRLLCRR